METQDKRPVVDVVAALIWRGNRFFACQRPKDKARANFWEFPGGKVEPGESHAEALVRECREELDITLKVGDLFCEVMHPYSDIVVRLFLYHCTLPKGTPKLLEHQAFAWLTTGEIHQYAFCPADRVILDKLQAEYPAR